MRHALLIAEFYRTPWAVLPETLAAMQMVLSRWADGVKLSAEEIATVVGEAPEMSAARREKETGTRYAGQIAVLPVYGIIGHRAGLVADSSSGVNTSTELLTGAFRSLVADPGVSAIVLDINSPGGSVFGVDALGDEIYAARGTKPVVAVANSVAASAAYWIGSAADEFVVAPGGEVGSIGTLGAHEDVSKMMEAKGVKTTLVSAGKYKVEGNTFEPLGAEAHAQLQSRVDEYYGDFVRAVARNRKDTQTAVREGYGQGRMVGAQGAVKANLADRVATFDQVIQGLAGKLRGSAGAKRAAADTPQLRAAKHDIDILG